MNLSSGERFWLEIKVKSLPHILHLKQRENTVTGASSPAWYILMFRSQRHKKTAEKTESQRSR